LQLAVDLLEAELRANSRDPVNRLSTGPG
jgi:hypothetical protein